MRVPWIDWVKVDRIIDNALQEDIGEGDVTTNTLFDESETASAYLMSKATGIVAGLNIAERVFPCRYASGKHVCRFKRRNCCG